MAGMYPIPTGRTSDILLHRRLLEQLTSDQSRLLQIQDQVSTGLRLSKPSDDPAAASKAISIQRIIEQTTQYQVNLQTTGSYLAATETAISQVNALLRDVKGEVLTAINATTSPEQKTAIVEQLKNASSQLMQLGNSKFRDRYLFAGSNPTQIPYEYDDQLVVFRGNETELQSIANLQRLLSSSISGNEVFGGLSTGVQGTIDFNPVLTEQTRLADIRGGLGFGGGSVEISDGTHRSIVHLDRVDTIADIKQKLQAGAPGDRSLAVEIDSDRLRLYFDDGQGGNLTIREVDGGTAATELGIVATNSLASEVIGEDLDPILKLTTKLSEVLGRRATVALHSPGDHNDIVLEALQVGPSNNGLAIQYVDDESLQAAPGLTANNEVVTYSSLAVAARAAVTFSGSNNNLVLTGGITGTSLNNVEIRIIDGGAIGNSATVNFDAENKLLEIGIDSAGQTEIQTAIASINAEGTFSAAYDASVASDGGYVPTATIPATDAGVVVGHTSNSGGDANTLFVRIDAGKTTANQVVAALEANTYIAERFDIRLETLDSDTSANHGLGVIVPIGASVSAGGSGEPLDLDSGIQVMVGAQTHVIDTRGAETVEDLINRFNQAGANVVAEINSFRNGIDVRSRVSGVGFSIGENGGTTATQLGLRTLTVETQLAELNQGRGVHTSEGEDFVIRRNDGVELSIDISAAKNIGDVLELINSHPDNQDSANQVTARLAETGNGIEIVDDNPPGSATLSITKSLFSQSSWDLGLVARGQLVAYPSDSATPTPATLALDFPPPNEKHTAFRLVASQAGTELNGVQVNVVQGAASGDQAFVSYDAANKTLTIDADPTATTVNTIIQQISLEGTFQASLDRSFDPGNNGSGIIAGPGPIGTTSGGSSQPSASSASASLGFAPPNDTDTAFRIEAAEGGTRWNGIEIELRDTASGDVAVATYDATAGKLYVDIDATATRTSTIINAVNLEGTFTAALDLGQDLSNDGSGIGATVGVIGTTSGGSAEILVGVDPNSLRNESIFDTLARMIDVLSGSGSVEEMEWLAGQLEADIERVEHSLGEIASRSRSVSLIEEKVIDEQLELRSTLSQELDVDLVAAISDLTAQQATFQASLQMIGNTFQLSLLDFL